MMFEDLARRSDLSVGQMEDRCVPATFVVNSAQDIAAPPPGVVTLRSALLAANADTTPDTITFAPALAGQTITLSLVETARAKKARIVAITDSPLSPLAALASRFK